MEAAAASGLKKKKKKIMRDISVLSRSNSSSCLDEQHACDAGAGRRCRPSVASVLFRLSSTVPAPACGGT